MSTDENYPDLDWYLAQSRTHGTPARCPFAHVRQCPRYFFSRSLLGHYGSTAIPPDEDAELMARWKDSDTVPVTAEDEPAVASSGHKHSFFKFCPEVLGDRFGWFVSDLSPHADKIDEAATYKFLEQRGISRSPHFTWSVCAPLHYLDCPTYSLLSHERKAAEPEAATSVIDDPWWQRRWILTWIGIAIGFIGLIFAIL